jgi:hypothetical protein
MFHVQGLLIGQAQVYLVNKCCALKRVVGTLLTKLVASQAPQFVIDKRQNRLKRFPVPISPMEE